MRFLPGGGRPREVPVGRSRPATAGEQKKAARAGYLARRFSRCSRTELPNHGEPDPTRSLARTGDAVKRNPAAVVGHDDGRLAWTIQRRFFTREVSAACRAGRPPSGRLAPEPSEARPLRACPTSHNYRSPFCRWRSAPGETSRPSAPRSPVELPLAEGLRRAFVARVTRRTEEGSWASRGRFEGASGRRRHGPQERRKK